MRGSLYFMSPANQSLQLMLISIRPSEEKKLSILLRCYSILQGYVMQQLCIVNNGITIKLMIMNTKTGSMNFQPQYVQKRPTAMRTLTLSTLYSGLLDASAGALVYLIFKGLNPVEVLQYIASGFYGDAAFSGGLLMAGVGLILHFVVAFTFAAGFFIVYPSIKLLSKNILVTGLLYGLFTWFVMNLVVLPNSNIPSAPFNFISVLEIIWHMALVGLPIAILTKRHYGN